MADFTDRNDYIRKVFAPETKAQKAARASLTGENDRISVPPEAGKILQVLLRLIKAKKIAEIGTLGGYSALWMADALPRGGRIYTVEREKYRADAARKTFKKFGYDKIITVAEGDAAKVLPKLSKKSLFDAVFIDADKISYAKYLDWAEKNVRKGGLIIGDNTFLFDAVWREEPVDRVRQTALFAMREFNKRLADPKRYNSILLPTGEGLTVAQKLF